MQKYILPLVDINGYKQLSRIRPPHNDIICHKGVLYKMLATDGYKVIVEVNKNQYQFLIEKQLKIVDETYLRLEKINKIKNRQSERI